MILGNQGLFVGAPPADSAGGDVDSNFWPPPAVAHPEDQEFKVLPPTWKLWRFSDNSDQTANIVPTVGLFSNPGLTTGKCALVANDPAARSHLLIQPFPAFGEVQANWLYAYRTTLGPQATLRSRMRMLIPSTTENNSPNFKLCIMKDVAGVPSLPDRIVVGYETDPGDAYIHMVVIVANVASYNKRSGNLLGITNTSPNVWYPWPFDAEFALLKNGDDYSGGIGGRGGASELYGYAAAASGFGGVVWIGYQFVCAANVSSQSPPFIPVMASDYYRRQDDLRYFG